MDKYNARFAKTGSPVESARFTPTLTGFSGHLTLPTDLRFVMVPRHRPVVAGLTSKLKGMVHGALELAYILSKREVWSMPRN